ncbi:hypothetical protein AAFF_G00276760 [Aldrovandia affinis]|uniref:ascorbate ferrireductase (transmembrane) n=1 Tax=Aldrovandia affinis TaxID=143900 RepID=A0AAD7RD21_9TELE|nr:hypothetical protein AAFF_G00276760 [Aldrovandia affinis]
MTASAGTPGAQTQCRRGEAMQIDVTDSLLGQDRGTGEFWMYVWMRRIAVITAHVVALGLTILMSLLSRPGTSLFSWHPVLMSIAFCLCMTEAVLLFSAEGSPFCFKSKKGRVRLHWLLQGLVVGGGAVGVAFMVASKRVSERPHMASWHSVLGAGTLALTALQAAGGLCLLAPPAPLRGPLPPPRLRLYHATAGLVAYLLAVATVTLAMFTDWFQATVKGPAWYALVLLPLLPALVVMNQVTSAHLPRRKNDA